MKKLLTVLASAALLVGCHSANQSNQGGMGATGTDSSYGTGSQVQTNSIPEGDLPRPNQDGSEPDSSSPILK